MAKMKKRAVEKAVYSEPSTENSPNISHRTILILLVLVVVFSVIGTLTILTNIDASLDNSQHSRPTGQSVKHTPSITQAEVSLVITEPPKP